MLSRTLARPAAASALLRPHCAAVAASARVPHFRAISSSLAQRKDPGEGVGEKKAVGGDNPVSARAKGVAKGVKGVAEGVTGIAQEVTGESQSNLGTSKKVPGADSRDVHKQARDQGMKEGLAHKGEQQGAI
ncbi:hypothetical protein Rhopal_006687-T1 [Rhodotorula paludigena]|uniref:CsbD-like domain-containing protein n=1 Tax=Rhodotorula paludigena TaxID=86838 RepID=A0AAV5GVX3_9BASI|nr:hypothetical protein Rhopal_006687-T1 [Rhodotorula paludigena]